MLSIANNAAQVLQKRILSGEFPPGSALPSQRRLADTLSISRTSLREAISTLEALGLVYTQPGKGVFVTQRQSSTRYLTGIFPAPVRGTALMSPRQLIEFRLALEPGWVALAVQHATDAEIDSLEGVQEQMELALHKHDFVIAADEDLHFHMMLAQMSHNPGIVAVAQQFQTQIAHSLKLPFAEPSAMWEPATEHRQIVQAMRQRDSQAAALAMQNHLLGSARRIGIDRP